MESEPPRQRERVLPGASSTGVTGARSRAGEGLADRNADGSPRTDSGPRRSRCSTPPAPAAPRCSCRGRRGAAGRRPRTRRFRRTARFRTTPAGTTGRLDRRPQPHVVEARRRGAPAPRCSVRHALRCCRRCCRGRARRCPRDRRSAGSARAKRGRKSGSFCTIVKAARLRLPTSGFSDSTRTSEQASSRHLRGPLRARSRTASDVARRPRRSTTASQPAAALPGTPGNRAPAHGLGSPRPTSCALAPSTVTCKSLGGPAAPTAQPVRCSTPGATVSPAAGESIDPARLLVTMFALRC